MIDSLIFRAKGLRRPGLPVIYENEATNSHGWGVIVNPPESDDPEDKANLVWWIGEMSGKFSEIAKAFSSLVGPLMGVSDGTKVRVCVPWLLEIDLRMPEACKIAIEWAKGRDPSLNLSEISTPEEIEKACWQIVQGEIDEQD